MCSSTNGTWIPSSVTINFECYVSTGYNIQANIVELDTSCDYHMRVFTPSACPTREYAGCGVHVPARHSVTTRGCVARKTSVPQVHDARIILRRAPSALNPRGSFRRMPARRSFPRLVREQRHLRVRRDRRFREVLLQRWLERRGLHDDRRRWIAAIQELVAKHCGRLLRRSLRGHRRSVRGVHRQGSGASTASLRAPLRGPSAAPNSQCLVCVFRPAATASRLQMAGQHWSDGFKLTWPGGSGGGAAAPYSAAPSGPAFAGVSAGGPAGYVAPDVLSGGAGSAAPHETDAPLLA
jgi:hypothetical protein